MSFNISTVAFLGAVASVLAIGVFGAPNKPWLYIAGALLAVGFLTQDSST